MPGWNDFYDWLKARNAGETDASYSSYQGDKYGYTPSTYWWDALKSGVTDVVDTATGVKGARIQEEAQEKQLEEQERIAQDQMAWLDQQTDVAEGYIGSYTNRALAASGSGYDRAADLLRQSHISSGGYLGEGYSGALGSQADAWNQARWDMQGLTGLQGYAAGATQAIPSRAAALMDGGLAAGFEADPGYQFRKQQGEEAINAAASARGGRLSGRTLEELSQFNQGLASQEYGQYAQRQMGLAGQVDQAQLAAQQNQMALAQMGYGAQGQLAGMGYQAGMDRAGLQQMYGSQMSGLDSQYGSQYANLYSTQGTNAAQLLSGAGSNMANAALGTAGQQTSLAQGLMGAYGNAAQYAGMTAQAQSNAMWQAAATAATAL